MWKFVEENKCDTRKVLNSLQFQLINQKLHNNNKQIQYTNSKLSIKSYLKHIKLLSELDAAYGCNADDTITWRAQVISNLDFNLDNKPAYQPFYKENISMMQSPFLNEILEKFALNNQLSPLFNEKFLFIYIYLHQIILKKKKFFFNKYFLDGILIHKNQ